LELAPSHIRNLYPRRKYCRVSWYTGGDAKLFRIFARHLQHVFPIYRRDLCVRGCPQHGDTEKTVAGGDVRTFSGRVWSRTTSFANSSEAIIIMGAMERANSTQTCDSGSTMLRSVEPPYRTASGNARKCLRSESLRKKRVQLPIYAGDLRSRNIALSSVSAYSWPDLVRNPFTTRKSQSMRAPRSATLDCRAIPGGVLCPAPIAVKMSSSIAVRMASVR